MTDLALFEPLQHDFMRNAYAAGTMVAIVVAVVGFFVVLRGLTFAGEALAHVGFSGAAGATVLSLPPVYGMFAVCIAAAVAIGLLGERLRDRDVSIGIVTAFGMGLGALFLSLYTRYATQTFNLLFGTILGVSEHDLVVTAVAGAVTLLGLLVIGRPLLYASIDPDVAAARGVPVRLLSAAFVVLLAIAVAQAVQVVGILLLLSLLVGPPASASWLTRGPGSLVVVAVILGLLETWAGITLSYFYQAPVSFFIAALSFAVYVGARFLTPLTRRAASP